MAKKIFGRVIDNSNKAVEFGVVYVSDVNGKPIGNINTTTDDKGNFLLNSVNDTDYITSKMVGLKPTTISVKDAKNIGGGIFGLTIKMNQSEGVNLQEVVVKPKPEEPPKKGMSKALKMGLIIGGSVLALIIVAVLVKKSLDKKTI